MTSFSLSLCFIGILLVCDASMLDWRGYELDPATSDLSEIDSAVSDDDSVDDFPLYIPVLHVNEEEEEEDNINTEENEIETGEKKPKPSVEVFEVEKPDKEHTDFDSSSPPPDVLAILSNVVEAVRTLQSDLETQKAKVAALEDAGIKFLLKIDSIEQLAKTNSIILSNVRQDGYESSKTTLQKVLHIFNMIMRVRMTASDISVALRAESNTAGRNKPIVVRFTNFANKMRVLGASKRLSHTNITVSSDYSELVAQKRAALLPYLKAARAEGRRAFILYDKLVVDGESHTLEELEAEKQNRKEQEQVDIVEDDC